MITHKNYLNVYKYEKWNARTIPVFQRGDTFVPSSFMMTEHNTVPPPLLTESDLIALMDKNGIG